MISLDHCAVVFGCRRTQAEVKQSSRNIGRLRGVIERSSRYVLIYKYAAFLTLLLFSIGRILLLRRSDISIPIARVLLADFLDVSEETATGKREEKFHQEIRYTKLVST